MNSTIKLKKKPCAYHKGQLCYLFSHKMCKEGYMKTFAKPLKRSTTQLKRSPIKKNHKPTGELAIFREIWNERPHVCELCGEILYEFSHELFHHKKPKGKYPELRLDKNNIMLIDFDCHFKLHNKGNSTVPTPSR
jgi:5-methylcytosine-specific restriction endonuclease McrA